MMERGSYARLALPFPSQETIRFLLASRRAESQSLDHGIDRWSRTTQQLVNTCTLR